MMKNKRSKLPVSVRTWTSTGPSWFGVFQPQLSVTVFTNTQVPRLLREIGLLR